ncbi:MAG: enoyl-CoA hydratase/isomerase family protein [Candidatus Eisenbacteria bacterium]|nr:enoyl-CoA hydratase/isomerase family protein [Candidatus Eisenbacteria bacterium]
MKFANLLVERSDRVATVTVNRPDKLNALNHATLEDLSAAFTALAADADTGVVILTGAGAKSFVAGADISELAQLDVMGAREFARHGQAVLDKVEQCPKPVIGAVNGFALGGGCELCMATHIRLASANARFGQPEVNLGVIPGFAGTQRLSRLAGRGRALHMILTGDALTAEEAFQAGLVQRVLPSVEELRAEASRMAGTILSRGPLAVRLALQSVQRGLEMPFTQAQQYEGDLFALAYTSSDAREGLDAFLNKRKPAFRGL